MNWKELNPANASNRYDYVGLDHNLLLDEFISNKKLPELHSQNSLSFVNRVIDFMLTRAIELTSETPTAEQKNKAYAACCAAFMAKYETSRKYLQITDMSNGFQQIWAKIVGNILKLTSANVYDIISNLKLIDTEIIDNTSFSDNERTTLLAANSVARYSSAYWTTEVENPYSPWFDKGNTMHSSEQPPQWVYTDIKGALVGALFGANPFIILGSAAVNSALDAMDDVYNNNNNQQNNKE